MRFFQKVVFLALSEMAYVASWWLAKWLARRWRISVSPKAEAIARAGRRLIGRPWDPRTGEVYE
jgi:hypothetical protein